MCVASLHSFFLRNHLGLSTHHRAFFYWEEPRPRISIVEKTAAFKTKKCQNHERNKNGRKMKRAATDGRIVTFGCTISWATRYLPRWDFKLHNHCCGWIPLRPLAFYIFHRQGDPYNKKGGEHPPFTPFPCTHTKPRERVKVIMKRMIIDS